MKKLFLLSLVAVGSASFGAIPAAARNPLSGGLVPADLATGGPIAQPTIPYPDCDGVRTPRPLPTFPPYIPDCGWGGPRDLTWKISPSVPWRARPLDVPEYRIPEYCPEFPTVRVYAPRPTQPAPICVEAPPKQDPPVISQPIPTPVATAPLAPPANWQQQYGKHRKPFVPQQLPAQY